MILLKSVICVLKLFECLKKCIDLVIVWKIWVFYFFGIIDKRWIGRFLRERAWVIESFLVVLRFVNYYVKKLFGWMVKIFLVDVS